MAALGWAAAAQADTTGTATGGAAAASQVETITVTAERKTEDIQKAPLAITEVSGDDLKKSNINHLNEINGLVPSLTIAPSAGFETVVTIRGVGDETPENALTTSPGVALLVDGAYVANSVALDQTLFDVSNVQVLRGPQGALYGESATGGAILIQTKQPTFDAFGLDANVSYGTFNLHTENADVNIPITDDFAILVSGQQYSHDGYTRNTFYPHNFEDDANDLVGKLAALWKPTNDLSISLSTEFYHAYQNPAAQKNINDPNASAWVITQDFVPRFNMATNLTHLNIDWDVDGLFLVKSVTAYQWLANVQGEDSSRSAFSILGTYDDVAAWNTSLQNYNEELDIQSEPGGPLDWDVGGFGLSQRSHQFVVEFECGGSISCVSFPPTPANLTVTPGLIASPTGNIGYGNVSDTNRKSWAFFGQATYHFTDDLSVTGGARFNSDSYADTFTNFFSFGNQGTHVHSFTDHVVTWHGEMDWQATPDNLLYVSVNRGYKPGGVNGENGQAFVCTNPGVFNPFLSNYGAAGCNFGQFLETPNVFKPETNTAFEVGSKNNFFDDALTVNVAGFYYVYNNYQYITTDPVPFDGGMTNIPSTHVWGGELEAWYRAMDDRLKLHGDMSLEGGSIQGNYKTIDSTLANAIEPVTAACTEFGGGGAFFDPRCWYAVYNSARNVGGNPPAKMPSVLGSVDASYDFRIKWGLLTPRAQVVYRGSYWARIFDEPALDRVPAYTQLNLNLQFVPDNSNFMFQVAATNVTNTAGVANQYTDPYGTGQTSRQYIAPRQVIGTVSYKW